MECEIAKSSEFIESELELLEGANLKTNRIQRIIEIYESDVCENLLKNSIKTCENPMKNIAKNIEKKKQRLIELTAVEIIAKKIADEQQEKEQINNISTNHKIEYD